MPTLPVDEWLKQLSGLYNSYGYLIVFLGTLGENTAFLGFLLPGNSLALLAAVYARRGTLNLGWVILLASLGTVLGYHVDYLFGRFVLSRGAHRWSTSKLGRRMRLAGRVRLAQMFVKKHGGKAILISHIVGQLRSFVALGAGMSKMDYRRFLTYELVAAFLWNTAFCLLGYLLAGEVERIRVLIERMGWVLLGIVVLLLLVRQFFKRYWRQRVKRGRLKGHVLNEER
ncbi:MAG: DedA family protein [Chloroflexi bacterium]|nr:MAG: DedA family protein [Chloroflexota bacterium]